MTWQGVGLTDVGKIRTRNEDALSVLNHASFWVVADGMGGNRGGDVASRLAVDTISRFIEKRLSSPQDSPKSMADEEAMVVQAVGAGHKEIRQAALLQPELEGMGTTVVAARITTNPSPQLIVGHVGDSRAYLLRGGTLTLLTRDHTLVERFVRKGLLTPEEALRHPNRHVLTRALGTIKATPVVGAHSLQEGDRILLCTDGLTTLVGDE
jgi:protein phosphatase